MGQMKLTAEKLYKLHDPEKHGEFTNDAYLDMFSHALSVEKQLEAYKEELRKEIEKLKGEYHDNWHPIVTDILSLLDKPQDK